MCGPHGTCIAPNFCECEDGWEGQICIDISHDTVSIQYEILSDWNLTYYVVFGVIIASIAFAIFLLVIKVKRDKYFIPDMQELGYYIGNCCRRKDSNYSVVYTDEDIELDTIIE